MLQTSPIQYESAGEPAEASRLRNLTYYLDAAKRRILFFIIPFLLVTVPGAAIVMMTPAVYSSEARILVQTQRIPTDLVRPTVANSETERIQIIEQRLMTRDNMLALIEKHQLFAGRRGALSNTELVTLMRASVKIEPLEVTRRATGDRVAMAFNIGFEYGDPEVVTKVAGDLVALILNEDLRNRTSRATETTKFLGREVTRLQAELNTADVQLNEARRARAEAVQETFARQRADLDQANTQLAKLKAERVAKANQFSWNHPEVQAIRGKITALERRVAAPEVRPPPESSDEGLESFQNHLNAVQKSLDDATDKLAAARMGEALERDQQAEKLEVIEQPERPQWPIRPKRLKLLGMVLGLGLFAGVGLAGAVEFFDGTVRSRADLLSTVGSHLISGIPYVETRGDRVRRRARLALRLVLTLAVIGAGLAAVHLHLRPLDVLWQQASEQFPRYIERLTPSFI